MLSFSKNSTARHIREHMFTNRPRTWVVVNCIELACCGDLNWLVRFDHHVQKSSSLLSLWQCVDLFYSSLVILVIYQKPLLFISSVCVGGCKLCWWLFYSGEESAETDRHHNVSSSSTLLKKRLGPLDHRYNNVTENGHLSSVDCFYSVTGRTGQTNKSRTGRRAPAAPIAATHCWKGGWTKEREKKRLFKYNIYNIYYLLRLYRWGRRRRQIRQIPLSLFRPIFLYLFPFLWLPFSRDGKLQSIRPHRMPSLYIVNVLMASL